MRLVVSVFGMLLGIAVSLGDADAQVAGEASAEPKYLQAVAAAREGNAERTLDALEAALDAGACPTRALTEKAFADLHVTERFHELIRKHARQSSTVLVISGEPGTPMVVSGVVRDAAGRPIAGARLHVFHADVKGEYTPTKAMDEARSRIFGYLLTDGEGWYEFKTVRPGGYANAVRLDGADRLIPQHIHFEVRADGFKPRDFQMVFDDDPRMDDHWRNLWAGSQKAPIVSVLHESPEKQTCIHDILLDRE